MAVKPVVTVVMPVLNAAPYLGEAIESILGQSFGDLELIVVDDGSSDDSVAIGRDYAARDGRVRHIALPRNARSVSGARASNIAFDLARGDYIARMDADDVAMPERLAVQLAALRERDLDICGGQIERFGDRNGAIWYPETHEAIARELVFRTGLANGTMLARAAVIKAARYNENEAVDQLELWYRLIFQVRMGNCSQTVYRLRVHPGMTTHVLTDITFRSGWGLRFRYFFRLFPAAGPRDFRCTFALACGSPLETLEELTRAGEWLVRLSRVPELRLRQRMARRWAAACELFGIAIGSLRDDYDERILAAP